MREVRNVYGDRCKVYGPYPRADGRKHVILCIDGRRTTVSYPKFLMEVQLGRRLEEHETVDHIDRDFTNNSLENLQVLPRMVHQKLDALRNTNNLLASTCVQCGKQVVVALRNLQNAAKKGRAAPFCSRKCSGHYGAAVQNKKKVRMPAAVAPAAEKAYLSKKSLQ